MSACAVWEMRWSKTPTDGEPRTKEGLKDFMKKIGKKWVFQEERGDSGYEHFQGRVSLFKKRRKQELLRTWQAYGYPVPEYLEPTTSSEHQKEAFYCTKLDSRVDGPWSNKDDAERWIAPEWDTPAQWYPWQEKVIASREDRNTRFINLVIDPVGNHGKTHLAINLKCRGLAVVLPILTDAKEICECVCDILMATQERDPRMIIMDLPRAMNKKALAGVFVAIEQVKNGLVVDRRYSYRDWPYRPPQVWVFTNRAPNMNYMSVDRWKLWTFEGNDIVDITPQDAEELERQEGELDEEVHDESRAYSYRGGYA